MPPTDLPDDPAALKRIIAAMQAEHAETVAALQGHVGDLEAELAALKRRTFGRRAERLGDNQLSLLSEATDPAAALAEASAPQPEPAPPKRRRRRGGRGQRSLPDHLPVISVTSSDPGPTACSCCGGDLDVIGEDLSERLEYIPGRFVKLRIHRTKRACPKCPSAGVFTQPTPPFGLDRALPGDGLLAKIVTDKFADNIPLNRQSKRFLREGGVEVSVSTMCGWMRSVGGLMKHIVDAMHRDLLTSRFLQSDATGLPILDGSAKQARRGHLWSYTDGTQVVFEASMTGQQIHPAKVLDGFAGTLLTDGAGAYNLITQSDDVVRAGCWAHVRRKFFDARVEAPTHAGIALASIREVFAVERELVDLEPEHRARLRRERLAGCLEALRERLDTWSTTTRPTSALGKAITYARNQWPTLIVFLDDGLVPVHNNTSERLLRGPVTGRKNWLFAGSEGGAATAATCFSIVASCMMAGIDPYEYIRDVLSLLPDATPRQLTTLTPKAWAARFGPEPA